MNAEEYAKNAKKMIRNIQRDFVCQIKEWSTLCPIDTYRQMKVFIGDYKKNSSGQLEVVEGKEGKIYREFMRVLSSTRHEFEIYAQDEIKKELSKNSEELQEGLNNINTSLVNASLTLGIQATLTLTAITTTVMTTQMVTTTSPLWGLSLLGSLGLTTTTTAAVTVPVTASLVTTMAAFLIGTGVAVVTAGAGLLFLIQYLRQKMIENLDNFSESCIENIDKMKFEALKAIEERKRQFERIKTGDVEVLKLF